MTKRNQKKIRDSIILGGAVAAAIFYIATRFLKKEAKTNPAFTLAKKCIEEQKYQEALEHLMMIEEKEYDVLLKIFECHERLGNKTNALLYLDRCIKEQRDIQLIQRRFELHSTLEMKKEAFKDLFLVNLIKKEEKYKERAIEYLKKICAQLASAHKPQGHASRINYTDFFETQLFLKTMQDPAIVFINSGEYEKCYEYIKSSPIDLHRFLLGCFSIVNGEPSEASRILGTIKTPQSEILQQFIRSKRLTGKEVAELKERIKTESDPTVLYYMYKIFERQDEKRHQIEALEKSNKIEPNSVATSGLVVCSIRQKREDTERRIETGLKDYPESINLVCIALEYYIMQKRLEEAAALLEKAEKLFGDDPRVFLFKYTLGVALGEPNREYLRQGIKKDPKYFRLYIYLGDSCDTGEESVEVFRKALECARSYEEVFEAYQLLYVVEAQNELYKEHPDLFQ